MCPIICLFPSLTVFPFAVADGGTVGRRDMLLHPQHQGQGQQHQHLHGGVHNICMVHRVCLVDVQAQIS